MASNTQKSDRLITRRRVLGMLGIFGGFTYTFLDAAGYTSSLTDFTSGLTNFAQSQIDLNIERRSIPSPEAGYRQLQKNIEQNFRQSDLPPEDLPQCPYETELLEDQVEIDTSEIPTWEQVDQTLQQLEFNSDGGCWTPTDCAPEQHVAVIIPYKNREEHLKALLQRLHPMLQRQKTSYCIFVAEQEDDGRFNKGAVMNAAFTEVMKIADFDCVIFHDVDMLPESDRNIYQCQNSPTHLSPLIDKFGYKPYGTDFGGITMLRPSEYIKANGMSNLFWGWGREDDDMQHRIELANLSVLKPRNYDSARYKMIPHQHPWIFRNFKLRDSTTDVRYLPPEYLVKYKDRSPVEGVSSVDYTLARTQVDKYFTKLFIELRRIVVSGVETFQFDQAKEIKIGSMEESSCEYVKMENTRICEEYGHTMVLKSLRKKNLSYNEAVKMCDELGYMCVGFTEDLPGQFKLREVTQFMSRDTVGSDCNTRGDMTFHKQCRGNPSFVQLNSDVILPSYERDQHIPFQHRISLSSLVPTRGSLVFRQALLVEGVQIGPIYTRTFDQVGQVLNVDFSLPVPTPGYYTLVSKLTDELGQPLYEWKSSIRVTSGDFDKDVQLRKENDIHQVFDSYGWDIQTYDDFKSQFDRLYEMESRRL